MFITETILIVSCVCFICISAWIHMKLYLKIIESDVYTKELNNKIKCIESNYKLCLLEVQDDFRVFRGNITKDVDRILQKVLSDAECDKTIKNQQL